MAVVSPPPSNTLIINIPEGWGLPAVSRGAGDLTFGSNYGANNLGDHNTTNISNDSHDTDNSSHSQSTNNSSNTYNSPTYITSGGGNGANGSADYFQPRKGQKRLGYPRSQQNLIGPAADITGLANIHTSDAAGVVGKPGAPIADNATATSKTKSASDLNDSGDLESSTAPDRRGNVIKVVKVIDGVVKVVDVVRPYSPVKFVRGPRNSVIVTCDRSDHGHQ